MTTWGRNSAVAAAAILLCGCARAQNPYSTYSPPARSAPTTVVNGNTDDPLGHFPASMQWSQIQARKVLRRRALVDGAARLLALTRQFQAAAQEHPVLTEEDERRLNEIAKQARAVKDEMKQ